MAKLLLIKGTKNVIGVYDDNKNFTPHELDIFDCEEIEGEREDVDKKRHDDLGLKQAFKSETTEWTTEMPDMKHFWTDGDTLKEIVEKPKYLHSFVNGEFVNNIAKNPKNHEATKIKLKDK